MSRADYTYRIVNEWLYIVDLNKDNMSVTNDIECVIAEIEFIEGHDAFKRVFYCDSEGIWDEVIGWPGPVEFMLGIYPLISKIIWKWDFEKHEYETVGNPYEIQINPPLYMITRCPNCGKELFYGETYTSIQWHNNAGLGYGVCEECSLAEWKEQKKYGDRI